MYIYIYTYKNKHAINISLLGGLNHQVGDDEFRRYEIHLGFELALTEIMISQSFATCCYHPLIWHSSNRTHPFVSDFPPGHGFVPRKNTTEHHFPGYKHIKFALV